MRAPWNIAQAAAQLVTQMAPALVASAQSVAALRNALCTLVDESAYAHVRADAFVALAALVPATPAIAADASAHMRSLAVKRAEGGAEDAANAGKLIVALERGAAPHDAKKRKTTE